MEYEHKILFVLAVMVGMLITCVVLVGMGYGESDDQGLDLEKLLEMTRNLSPDDYILIKTDGTMQYSYDIDGEWERIAMEFKRESAYWKDQTRRLQTKQIEEDIFWAKEKDKL